MHRNHLPSMGPRYWAILSIVSVFGANLGDFSSHDLHLGHAWGLIPMAVLLAGVFILERRGTGWNQAYYWLAIIIVRAAATNLADLFVSDLKFGRDWAVGGLTMLLIVSIAILPIDSTEPTTNRWTKRPDAFPPVNTGYWISMLIAGTLGTVLGDYASFGLHLGTQTASLVLVACLAAVYFLGSGGMFAIVVYYWFAVVVVRAAGTALGDHLAGRQIGIGLPLSTLCTGLLVVLVLWLWKDEVNRRAQSDIVG